MWDVVEASAVPSKVCAACGGRYPGDALFCPTDGTRLQTAAAAEREPADPYLGQEISGHIEIRQLVGVGAMGRVYRAFQRGIDRDVAVKILHRELSANAQLVARFTREAKVASRLQHPNVVQVFLAGQLPDRAMYIVMEYLDGLSLQSALAAAGGALPLNRAIHIALQLCEATGEAHAQNIVHRDLKPENVMLVRRGSDPDCVKVLDFGIARLNWGDQSVATAAGLIFGTARYISPEGAQGEIVGPAGDVYSIATLLYQMLSGRTPFDGDQAVGILVQQIHDPAPPLRAIPRAAYVPEPIANVVMASLAKNPAAREPDARAFGQAIFDAARLAGLSPEEFSRPMLKREPSAMKLPPVERTKQLELTPEVVSRMTPPEPVTKKSADPSIDPGQRRPTEATVKWEPPPEFQARLTPSSPGTVPPVERGAAALDGGVRGRAPSSVDETIDDMMVEPRGEPSTPHVAKPFFPTPFAVPTREPSGHELPRTVPGDVDGPPRTQYTPPVVDVTSAPALAARPVSNPELALAPSTRSRSGSLPDDGRAARVWPVIVLCFVLGASIAFGWAWKVGKIGSDADAERYVARATDAMFKNHFYEPPGENVKDLTDEGLRRWPNEHRFLDVRIRAASELTSQAIALHAAGDLNEALKLAKVAHVLDPHDASAKRLVEQYESELAAATASAAPTLPLPPERPPAMPSSPPKSPASGPSVQAVRTDYKVVVDVSAASPRLGQTVELIARVVPSKGSFGDAGFTIVGPGVPGGVRMPARNSSPGVFRASYAFLEAGRFEVSFLAQESGRVVTAKRSINAGEPASQPQPLPSPAPSPTPTGSVKWM
ncbi:MAG TPA: protein kinase [Labilithrix sp.]|nr:protein kinase [Labilithrix sp.]